jgi:hypothetical protein
MSQGRSHDFFHGGMDFFFHGGMQKITIILSRSSAARRFDHFLQAEQHSRTYLL